MSPLGKPRRIGLLAALLIFTAACGGREEGSPSQPRQGEPGAATGAAEQAPTPALVRLTLAPVDPLADAPAAEPITLREELRQAQALGEDERLAAELPAAAGGTLRFGYGLSQTPRRAGRPPPNEKPVLLQLAIEDERGGVVHAETFEFPTGGSRQAHWKDALVALDGLPARPLRVTFRIEVGSKRGVVAAIAGPRVVRPVQDPATVLLLTSDTHRADHLGALGEAGVGVDTPVLDRLAARGVLFEDCFSAINHTGPSHGSILTSLPVRDTGVLDNTMGLTEDALTVAEVFRQSGYATLAVVSVTHLRHRISGLGQGFDRMHAPDTGEVAAADSIATLAAWLAEEQGVPVFLWLHVFDAHAPYTPPEELRRRYYPEQGDPRTPAPGQPAGFEGVPWDRAARDFEFVRAQYMSEVTALDAQLDSLLAHPRIARGVIAFTADHGEVMHGHGIFFNHHGIYPDTLSVPLILVWPGAPAGRRVSRRVSNVDVGHTLLALAGLETGGFPGLSLTRWLEDGTPPEPRFAISDGGATAAIEEEGWLLLLSLRAGKMPRTEAHQVELYDLSRDPACEHDLLQQELERARGMRARLIQWLDRGRGSLARSARDDPQLRRQLAAMGYSGSDGEIELTYEPDPGSRWCRMFDE